MHEAPYYRLGPFRLDAIGKRLQHGDTRLDTDAQQVDVLLCLIRAFPGIVAKNELIERVWGGRFVTDAALHKTISELRKVLREAGDGQEWIETRHRRGYQLREAAIPELPETPRQAMAGVEEPPANRPRRRRLRWTAVLAIVFSVLAGVWWWLHVPPAIAPDRPVAAVVEGRSPLGRSYARWIARLWSRRFASPWDRTISWHWRQSKLCALPMRWSPTPSAGHLQTSLPVSTPIGREISIRRWIGTETLWPDSSRAPTWPNRRMC